MRVLVVNGSPSAQIWRYQVPDLSWLLEPKKIIGCLDSLGKIGDCRLSPWRSWNWNILPSSARGRIGVW